MTLRIWPRSPLCRPSGTIGAYRAEATFGTWLYRIAANRCMTEARKRRPVFRDVDDIESSPHAVTMNRPDHRPDNLRSDDPEQQYMRKELMERVEAAINDLPESQRLLFVLATQMGMKYRDIGQIVDISEDAVKVRIHRARKRVRDALSNYLDT